MTVTTTTTPVALATQPQRDYIADLLANRDMSDEVYNAMAIATAMPDLSKKAASAVIDTLLKFPKKPITKSAATPTSKMNPVVEALIGVPNARYAIPNEHVDLLLSKTNLTGDMLFVEVREYKGTRYMRRLTGSFGGFTRSRIDTDDAVAIATVIAADPYAYTKMFGEHYSCCGKCGAELTDPVSRSLFLGPTCRQAFGR